MLNMCNGKLSPFLQLSYKDGGAHGMGICPGQAPMTMSPFCLLWVKTVPPEEDSASGGVLAGQIQSLIAISSVSYAFASQLQLR